MSAIVHEFRYVAVRAAICVVAESVAQADDLRAQLERAGRAIVFASNAAQRWRVVNGAPRTWAVRWWQVMSDVWVCTNDATDFWIAYADAPSVDLRPTWDAANRLWVWSSAAHDPRPCAWPRPFARGADR